MLTPLIWLFNVDGFCESQPGHMKSKGFRGKLQLDAWWPNFPNIEIGITFPDVIFHIVIFPDVIIHIVIFPDVIFHIVIFPDVIFHIVMFPDVIFHIVIFPDVIFHIVIFPDVILHINSNILIAIFPFAIPSISFPFDR